MKYLLLLLVFTVLNLSVLGQNKPTYKIWSEKCKDNKCRVFAFVGSKGYCQSNMQKLAEELAEKFKDKKVVNLRLFDDEKTIESFIEGKREPRDISSLSRAYFIHKADCGDMLFYKSEKGKISLAKISWKNTKSCNTPFTVF